MDISIHLPQGSQNIMEDKVGRNKFKSKRLETMLWGDSLCAHKFTTTVGMTYAGPSQEDEASLT